MSRFFITFAFLTLFSCNTDKTDNAVVSLPINEQVASVDTVRSEIFSYPIEYEKYQIDTLPGRRASINYASNRTSRRFGSAIKWSIDNFGVNFAGQYNLARWGCGTSCINGAITDLRTGLVYDLPPATHDYEFKKDSRLLVVNPPDSNGYYNYCSYCEPELWLWNDDKKKFEKLN